MGNLTWSGRGTPPGLQSPVETRATFWCSRRPSWLGRGVSAQRYVGCRSVVTCGTHARPCVGTAPGLAACSRTSSTLACPVALYTTSLTLTS